MATSNLPHPRPEGPALPGTPFITMGDDDGAPAGVEMEVEAPLLIADHASPVSLAVAMFGRIARLRTTTLLVTRSSDPIHLVNSIDPGIAELDLLAKALIKRLAQPGQEKA